MRKIIIGLLALSSISTFAQVRDLHLYGIEYRNSDTVRDIVLKIENDYGVSCNEGSVSGVSGYGIRHLSFKAQCFGSSSKSLELKVTARYSGQLGSLAYEVKKVVTKFR